MNFTSTDGTLASEVRTFVMGERRHCVSDREWKFRLRGYGYDVRQTARGTILHTLPHGHEVCVLEG